MIRPVKCITDAQEAADPGLIAATKAELEAIYTEDTIVTSHENERTTLYVEINQI